MARRSKEPNQALAMLISEAGFSSKGILMIMRTLARTHDHAETVLTHHDTPGTPVQDPQNAQVSAGQVKEQVKKRDQNKISPIRVSTLSGEPRLSHGMG
jgi:hypothetical protein